MRPPLVPRPAPGLRGRVERATAPVLVRLSSLPRFVVPVASVVLLVVGLAAPAAVGLTALLVLLVLIGWLTYLSWPAIEGVQRLVRPGVVALLVFALLGRLGT